MASDHPALAISGLTFSYPDNPAVLRDISIEIQRGEKVGLIGPNGAGKTTLFFCICGVLKPEAGEIRLLGRRVRSGDFHPEIGMVFQNPDDQLFCPSVWDDVCFGPQSMGLPGTEVERRARESLELVGHLDLARRAPHHLSGGEKRMISIAGVLAMKPQFVVYDEPSANLDIRSRRRVIRLLESSPQTLLVSSHDLELVLEVCGRVILMDEGRVVADGDPRTIMGDSDLMEAHGQEKPHSLIPHLRPH